MSDKKLHTRRDFLSGGLTLLSTATTLPAFIQQSALGIENPFAYRETSQKSGIPEDRILVVIQLAGGNDGLNTIIPFRDDHYYKARPQLGVAKSDVIQIDQKKDMGFHTSLAALKELYDDGVLAVLQGVGYPNPNRSHFKSGDIWQTADLPNGQGTGWLGRYFDNTCKGTPDPDLCIAIGREAPIATHGKKITAVSFENTALFKWSGKELHADVAKSYDQMNRAGVLKGTESDTPAAFLMRTAMNAQVSSARIRKAASEPSAVRYPYHQLARHLKLIGAMIRAEMPTRVYYATMGGFDTHAGQSGRHANLLKQYAESVQAFYNDLKKQGNHKQVLIMTFSEFGRRVKQNASAGTDHGTAAPMFVIGDMVDAGIHGKHPSLSHLDKNGDLIFNTDFRSVYATILDQWMKADHQKILAGKFKHIPFLEKKKVV